MTNLQTATKEEISAIAKEMGITLSYKDVNGKRQRYTKAQLIEMIVAKQVAPVAIEVKENKAFTPIKNEIMENEVVTVNLNTVVSDSRKLLASGQLHKVKKFIDSLVLSIKNERKNKLLVANMSNKVNILKALLKSYKGVPQHA